MFNPGIPTEQRRSIILIVDDQPVNQEILRAHLSTGPFEFLFADDGEQALTILKHQIVDLILLDVVMPGIDGIEVCRQIRARPSLTAMPVLIITSLDDSNSRLKGLEAGADDFITKPFDSAELRARVNTIARLNRYRYLLEQTNRLAYLEAYDPITELPNRQLFCNRLELALHYSTETHQNLVIFTVAVTNLTAINAALGHDATRMLLNRIGELLATIVPEQGSLARTGDQEFSFFDFANSPRNEALEYLQRIERVLELPLQLDQQYFYLDHSVGISAAPQDGTDAITLLGRAGTALAAAQRHGHEHFKFFHQELDSTVRQRLSLEAELRRALEREEFTLFYQPKLNLKTLTLGGAEALVRWQHPERGLLSPFHFIELAEETGLIEALGTWILQTACQQARAWQDQGIDIPRLAINISALQFRSGKLGQLVADTLTHHALSAERVELELTESLLMPEQGDDNHFVMQALQQFRELGVHISIDDFGTGYSSLSYLRRFPVDSLKIDRSFITGIPDNQSDANITRAIINLAHNLGLGVVAEGVETQAHQDFLASMNCDQVQGYWFSRPLPAVEFVKWVIDLAH